MKTLKISVFGKVQGVGFRASVYEIAIELGITGYIKNLDDSNRSVEISAQGDDNLVFEFVQLIKNLSGSGGISISEIIPEQITTDLIFSKFQIERED